MNTKAHYVAIIKNHSFGQVKICTITSCSRRNGLLSQNSVPTILLFAVFYFLAKTSFFFLITQWTLLRFFAFSVLWFQDVRIIYLVESSYKNCINWLFIIQHVYLVNWQRNSPWRWWSRIKLTVNIIVRTTHTQCVHFALGSFLLLISSHFLIDIV